jgi:16S rRNA (uracil1498-N3)-methyltransferase
MRAVYLKDLCDDGEIVIEGDSAFHLIKSVRIRPKDEVLILNGKGVKLFTRVKEVQKKRVLVSKEKVDYPLPKSSMDLLLGMPKKEAFESILKICCEIGIRSIIPLVSDYSQKGQISKARLHRVLESGIIQSNNPYIPEIKTQVDFNLLKELFDQYDRVFYFTAHEKSLDKESFKLKKKHRTLILIGPEGGFSLREEKLLETFKNISFKHFPSYILKSSTAVAVGAGHIFCKREN